jgi:hypothetical protein
VPFADWYAQANNAADVIELHFGEQVDLLPWTKETDQGFTEGGPDPVRNALMNVRVLFKAWEASQMQAFNAAIAQSTAYFVIKQALIDATGLTQNDRIRQLDPVRNGQLWEVLYVAKSSVGRPRVYVNPIAETKP